MLAIISDIHGNYFALESVLAEIKRIKCEQIICLGDMVGYYCMINECIELLKKDNVECILGNHDYYLIHNKQCSRSKTVNLCLNHQKRIIKSRNRAWLRDLPLSIENSKSSFVHGGWNNYLEEYLCDVSVDYFIDKKQKYFFSGHTHKQCLIQFGDKTYCNPGSVGQPRDGDSRAAFAVLDDSGKIYLKRVEYKIDAICQAMMILGYGDYIYKNLYNGLGI